MGHAASTQVDAQKVCVKGKWYRRLAVASITLTTRLAGSYDCRDALSDYVLEGLTLILISAHCSRFYTLTLSLASPMCDDDVVSVGLQMRRLLPTQLDAFRAELGTQGRYQAAMVHC